MKQQPVIGALVRSLAGRDSGEYYLVVDSLEPPYVLVVNGLNRPLKSPKKKNLRHLQIHGTAPTEVVEKIKQRIVRDEEIARAISGMVGKDQPGGEREGNIT
ncbi:MAG TPA: RNA-binding protein [Firmicutes bacterium]|jgi:ribosomal protein L14E/L6E/L27E|nr:RNA-binding protein [Bacillota bacterium]HAA37939.1 RNA-binding protein [Bacillota bacterium]